MLLYYNKRIVVVDGKSVQGHPGGKVGILVYDNISHYKKKS
jgi:hypothetical protein